ncbi:outer membrane receptor protein involved in Fe transport [Pseudoxanthomonas broegbernensis]|nr:TonB-dependent receptor [Pseudoxanthomonas broegbernensis]MBB6063891.1 outer membrane receptor protein involved in Fe transport [Pseudoxanthomonas broegbernensis]
MANSQSSRIAKGLTRTALSVALGLCFAGAVQAQSTTGNIYGSVAAGEGSAIAVTNDSGFNRTVSVDSSGRYNISSLPVGTYTVTLQRDGQAVATRNITVRVGAGVNVSFEDATTLATVTVTGANVAPIDITALDTRTVITAEQLERLPVARSAEAIALLAPGAVSGAGGYFGRLVSFGGAGISENAYYVNGYFTGEPLSNLGGVTLPYGAIEQQETYTGGYSAKYGRSDGGVISQIGKRGTNKWEFGGQVAFVPKSLREQNEDLYLPDIDLAKANSNPNIPINPDTGERYQYAYEDPTAAGTLYTTGKGESHENITYSAYVGGPIIRDRLFFFLSAEAYKEDTVINPTTLGTPRVTKRGLDDPRLYAKLDWNITDDHMLEFTYMKEEYERTGKFYDLDTGDRLEAVENSINRDSEYNILKYTGYLSDNITFSAVYGESDYIYKNLPKIIAGVPYVTSTTLQDPSITGGTPIPNRQGGYQARDARDKTKGLRADLEWVLGDHTLTLGVDNIEFDAKNEGTSQLADYWQYQRLANPNGNISGGLGVGAPGGDGYYVRQLKYFNNTNMSLEQKAWYLEDRWQITDNFLLSLGVRNDKFTNKNEFGEAYMDAKDQWAPRIGATWDVFGDSSFKVFANAGRYFLAMPNNVAIRGASASTYTWEYFTYNGIDSDGRPTGLTPVPGINGGPAPGPVSGNLETGARIDVQSFAPSDLKNMYQDEFILGMETMFTENTVLGAKVTYRDLKSSIDDFCGYDDLAAAAGLEAYAIDWAAGKVLAEDANGNGYQVSACYMFNPGGSNTYSFVQIDADGNPTGQRLEKKISAAELGFTDSMKRKYTALDIYWERPWDGKWEARVDYTFSFSKGNNEGQVKSEFGQDNISKTQDWDVAEMMRYSYGYLANDRRHQMKARGSYAITPEWSVGGNLRVQSGMPISCLGFYNPDGSIDETSEDADPVGYGASYHTCFGEIAKPGSQRTPWTKSIDLGVTYKPQWFENLTLGVQVFNVMNDNKPLQVDVTSEADAGYTVSNTYMLPIARQTPRYVMFTASLAF